MKSKYTKSYLSLGILFALSNLVAFLIPTEKTATFWSAYAFLIVSFAVQIPLWRLTFDKRETLKSKFFGISFVQIGAFYLVAQLIAFFIFKFFPLAPSWASVIACAILLTVFAISVIAGQVAVHEIERVEEKRKNKRAFIQCMQIDVEMLVEEEKDTDIKEMLERLAENVRFSDPMSHEMLGELETRISSKVAEIKTAVDKKMLIEEIFTLLKERNKKCKILK